MQQDGKMRRRRDGAVEERVAPDDDVGDGTVVEIVEISDDSHTGCMNAAPITMMMRQMRSVKMSFNPHHCAWRRDLTCSVSSNASV